MIYRDVRISRPEGIIDGDYVHVRGEDKMVEVRNIRGTAFPAQVAGYFAPKTAAFLERYQFLKPPTVTLDGMIDASGTQFRSDFKAAFKTDGPASFKLFKRELAITSPTGSIELKGDLLQVGISAGLLGGRADYSGLVGIGPRRGNFSGDLKAQAIDFGQLAELYEIPTQTRGTLGGELRFTVPAADPRRWSGTGQATLKDGDVFAIPTMGPLSKLVSGVLDKPKAGHSVANQASANFLIDRGVIHSANFEALTPGFILRAKGSIDTVEKQLDIDAEMNARGPLRLVSWPISKLLRYKGEGDLSDPTWRPVNFTLPRRRDDGSPGERPTIGGAVSAVPKATVDAGSKVLGTGAQATIAVGSKALDAGGRALGVSAKVIGAGARGAVDVGKGAMDVGNKVRDAIPLPRLLPKKEKEIEKAETEVEVIPAPPTEPELAPDDSATPSRSNALQQTGREARLRRIRVGRLQPCVSMTKQLSGISQCGDGCSRISGDSRHFWRAL
jgi:hypothetical protein